MQFILGLDVLNARKITLGYVTLFDKLEQVFLYVTDIKELFCYLRFCSAHFLPQSDILKSNVISAPLTVF